jgi:chorismate synthase
MSANSFGGRIQMHTFGESHGRAMGTLIDGFPAGVTIDVNEVQNFLDRRKPGTSDLVSARKEFDKLEIVSGIFEGKTLGTPICGLVYNQNARSEDYDQIKNQPRHGHAEKSVAG